ncbi:MAG: lysophospholipid acyltransferase family protein [Zetaproteobacteria bacterium]|nr:lysophospholipid acyltransferase family protein [Zetaproteobacteria bacterium]
MTTPAKTASLPPTDAIRPQVIDGLYPILRGMQNYHRYKVFGLENFPKRSRVVLATNHSLVTYDMVLLYFELWRQRGRIPRSLTDHLFFKIPYLGELIEELGSIEGTATNAKELLQRNEIVAVAPGGMKEALRPSSERYQIIWQRRRGFVRLAVETQSPIVLACCPKADDVYDVYSSPFTRWAYKSFRVPIFFARGLGLSFFPRPVELIHYVAKPLYPPRIAPGHPDFEQAVERFHERVVKRMEKLMGDAVTTRNPEDVPLHHSRRDTQD